MESFAVSPRAASRIAEIVAATGQAQALRVAVLAGGCSGFQYKFDLDANRAPDDLVIEREGAVVLVDPASLDLLAGAQLDYVDKLIGQLFRRDQPQRNQRLRLRHQLFRGLRSAAPARCASPPGTSTASARGSAMSAHGWSVRPPTCC